MKLLLSVIVTFFFVDSNAQTISKEEELSVYNQVKRIKSYVELWNTKGIRLVKTDSSKTVKMLCSRATNKPGDPLVIVDGAIMHINGLKEINPHDIQSVEVLKDKSALDRYGEKANHGVIVITMKCKKPTASLL